MKGWVVTRTAADGRPRYHASWRVGTKIKTRTFKRRKDADRYLVGAVGKVLDGTFVDITPTTFREYAGRWLDGLNQLKPSTKRAYGSILTYQLVPAFGALPLTALGVEQVNEWLALRETTLKPKTRRNCLTLLHKLLEDAREAGYLAVNRLHEAQLAAARPSSNHPAERDLRPVLPG